MAQVNTAQVPVASFTHLWRVKAKRPERYGQLCHVSARGKPNSCLMRFANGFQVVTSRNFVRKVRESSIGSKSVAGVAQQKQFIYNTGPIFVEEECREIIENIRGSF